MICISSMEYSIMNMLTARVASYWFTVHWNRTDDWTQNVTSSLETEEDGENESKCVLRLSDPGKVKLSNQTHAVIRMPFKYCLL